MKRDTLLLTVTVLALALSLTGCATTRTGEPAAAARSDRNAEAPEAPALAGTTDQLPVPDGSCGQVPAQRALVTAQLLGIAGVPYLIAPDGRLQQGVPAELDAWLEGKQ